MLQVYKLSNYLNEPINDDDWQQQQKQQQQQRQATSRQKIW